MSAHQKIMIYGAIICSVIVLGLYSVVTYIALTHEFKPEMHDVVTFVAGNVNAAALAVVGFWVGSSAGSMIKTATSAVQTEVKTGPQQP